MATKAAGTAVTNPKAGVVDTSTATNIKLDESRCAINDSEETQQAAIVGNVPSKCVLRTTASARTAIAIATTTTITTPISTTATIATAVNKKLLLCRRFKDSADGILRNFNSLPLFVYATSTTTHATSADGVGVAKEAAAAAAIAVNIDKNDSYELGRHTIATSTSGRTAVIGALECLPVGVLSGSSTSHSHSSSSNTNSDKSRSNICIINHQQNQQHTMTSTLGGVNPTTVIVGTLASSNIVYPHHINLNQTLHHHHLLSHQTPYTNNYPLQHSNSHHHIHSEQTKSLQELQHEVGALLEFRDLVIETFPDLKQKMASMSSSSTTSSALVANGSSISANAGNSVTTVSGTNTLTNSSSLVSRREWEPGIRSKRKISHKEPSTSAAAAAAAAVAAAATASANNGAVAAELSSSSLTRSRSNSHSGKKEPKSGENNNGSVVQDSGFSTETSSSKDGHSASSTNGALAAPIPTNRLSCTADDELLNLLDVIHRKSNRLREEVEQLQNYERQQMRNVANDGKCETDACEESAIKGKTADSPPVKLTPKTFREHVERLNKEDMRQLRKERDRLLDKLAEMEAETLTGRIKAAKMNDQVEELICVKKDLEEQLKLAMAQKLELSSRVQQLQQQQQQQQQQQLQSKSSSSQSDYSSPRNFLSSAITVLSTGGSTGNAGSVDNWGLTPQQQRQRQNTFQPVVIDQTPQTDLPNYKPFHQSVGSDNSTRQPQLLGRLDGIVSTPGARTTKSRNLDSKRFTAILLESNMLELQRHLLTLTVQNQVLIQKLEQSNKSKTTLAKRLDKSKDDVEDLRFQLEEKNIELEGTKAQLRILESRLHSATPISGATINSYLHSHHDYETNRSSASTTLVLSRRGAGNESHTSTDLRSSTPSVALQLTREMTTPMSTQISTPSMKAMVPLAMDELQHSSSTESAHDHEITSDNSGVGGGQMMSISVDGVSPFEQQKSATTKTSKITQQTIKKFIASGNKPSKIPLPGSKAAAYFAGKPPSGRPSTAGRSPPSTNGSYSSSKSSLSRSTGNLLYNKSPNSLKRADSAQSIRKDTSATSLSTNTSRSSTNSSSIPLATNTTPFAASTRAFNASTPISVVLTAAATPPSTTTTAITTPSSRVLQNSPLPKLKRETFASRVRHLDSLSRAHHHHHHHNANKDVSSISTTTSPNTSTSTSYDNAANHNNSGSHNSNSSYLISSTPKPSAIAAHLNATLRRGADGQQLSSNSFSHGSQQFLRRATGGNTTATAAATATTARRFSSASVVGARVAAAARNHEQHMTHAAEHHHSNGIGSGSGSGNNASDSDSGKCVKAKKKANEESNDNKSKNIDTTLYTCTANTQTSWGNIDKTTTRNTILKNNKSNVVRANGTKNVYIPSRREEQKEQQDIDSSRQHGQQYLWQDLWHSTNDWSAKEVTNKMLLNYIDYGQDEILQSISASVSDTDVKGSDKLLVTFDYGYSDSIDDLLTNGQYNNEYSFSEYAGATSVECNDISVETGVVLGASDTSYDDDDDDDDEDEDEDGSIVSINEHVEQQQSMPFWFKSNYAPTTVDDCNYNMQMDEMSTAFPVHHVQYTRPFADSQLSLNSSCTEYAVDVTEVDSLNTFNFRNSAAMLNYMQRLKAVRAVGEDTEEKDEEFYDSIEFATTTVG